MDSQGNVQLNYLVPIVAMDGHAVIVSEQGVPTLLFFQGRAQDDKSLKADVVAAVRFANLEDLKGLNNAITDTIEKHEKREP